MIKLQIDGVTEADLGRYRCQASNIYGTDNTIGQLNFESKNTFNLLSSARCCCCYLVNGFTRHCLAGVVRPLAIGLRLAGHSISQLLNVDEWFGLVLALGFAALAIMIALKQFVLIDLQSTFPCDNANHLSQLVEYVFRCNAVDNSVEVNPNHNADVKGNDNVN